MKSTKIIIGGVVAIGLLAAQACSEPSTPQEGKSNKDNQKEHDMTETKDSSNDFPKNQLFSADGYPVVFYNVENLFDTENDPNTSDDEFTPNGAKEWTEERYKKKVDDLVKVFTEISNQMPAVIGLAEIENKDVIIDLITHPKMQNSQYLIVHEESPDTRGIDVALIFDQNRFNYDFHESIRIDFPWDDNIKTRDILHVAGEFMNGDKVHFFVTHWPSRRDGVEQTEPKRLEVAGKLRARIDEIYADEENPKILVMGDFNDSPINKSVEVVLNAKVNSNPGKTVDNLDEGQLFNLSSSEYLDNKGSLVHDNQWELLDQMMASKHFLKDLDGTFLNYSAKTYRPEWILYRAKNGDTKPNKTYGGTRYYGGYSDHLPVYTILKHKE